MYTEACILFAVMPVYAKVNLFLSNICVSIRTLTEVWLYGFVVHKIQCHTDITWCLYKGVTGTARWHAADTQPDTYLLAHDVCGLHDALGQKSVAPGQNGRLLQGHAQGAPEHGNKQHGITDRTENCINRYVQHAYLLSMTSVS